jgi:hypothetical protein
MRKCAQGPVTNPANTLNPAESADNIDRIRALREVN